MCTSWRFKNGRRATNGRTLCVVTGKYGGQKSNSFKSAGLAASGSRYKNAMDLTDLLILPDPELRGPLSGEKNPGQNRNGAHEAPRDGPQQNRARPAQLASCTGNLTDHPSAGRRDHARHAILQRGCAERIAPVARAGEKTRLASKLLEVARNLSLRVDRLRHAAVLPHADEAQQAALKRKKKSGGRGHARRCRPSLPA